MPWQRSIFLAVFASSRRGRSTATRPPGSVLFSSDSQAWSSHSRLRGWRHLRSAWPSTACRRRLAALLLHGPSFARSGGNRRACRYTAPPCSAVVGAGAAPCPTGHEFTRTPVKYSSRAWHAPFSSAPVVNVRHHIVYLCVTLFSPHPHVRLLSARPAGRRSRCHSYPSWCCILARSLHLSSMPD